MNVDAAAYSYCHLMGERKNVKFDAHLRQVIIGWLSQGWTVTVWPLCEDEGCPHYGTPHICANPRKEG